LQLEQWQMALITGSPETEIVASPQQQRAVRTWLAWGVVMDFAPFPWPGAACGQRPRVRAR
jgi:hypothetical protein